MQRCGTNVLYYVVPGTATGITGEVDRIARLNAKASQQSFDMFGRSGVKKNLVVSDSSRSHQED